MKYMQIKQILATAIGKRHTDLPNALYVGLLTTGDWRGLSEPKSKCYERGKISTYNWYGVGSDIIRNSVNISFQNPKEDWGKIIGLAIYDKISGGFRLVEGPNNPWLNIYKFSYGISISAGHLQLVVQTNRKRDVI